MSDSVEVLTDKNRLDIALIHSYLSKEAYWAKGRSLEIVKRSIDNSFCFGVFLGNQQIGFARVVSDLSVFAWILDVFILPQWRGKGYGKILIEAILNHPDFENVPRWGLGTADAHGLYTQFGFTPLKNPEFMMELKKIENSLRK